MEIYKDMIEKLKFHRNIIINAFIRKNYYPSSQEVNDKLKLVNSRIALFESYISKPGSYMNVKELNYCFEMIAKDIEILYTVLEDILTNEFSALKIYIESSLSELESKAEYYRKRCDEEIHSTTLGTTVLFQANNWNVTENDETNLISLGSMDLIQGMEIACFINFKENEEGEVNEKLLEGLDVVFQFDNNDPEKSFWALPYNYNNNSYKVPGEMGINNYELLVPIISVVNDYVPIEVAEINFSNRYKIAGGLGGMQVTSKKTGETYLYKFANAENAFIAPEDCFVEFFVLDANKNTHMEYSFTEQPIATNFSLSNGKIDINTDAKRIFIECQKGLAMFFTLPTGKVYASFEDPVIVNSKTFLYKGNWNIKDFVLREYVRSNTSPYKINVFIKSSEDIISKLESIYIKEVTS